MEDKDCISDSLKREAGVDVSLCYQCGKCTAGCVLAGEMDYPPSYLMRLLQTRKPANDLRVLGSDAIWICLNCENCIARCPKEVDIPKAMDYLRRKSRAEGNINRQARPVVAFHSAFMQAVEYTGRSYEVGLVLGFKARTLRLLQDMSLVPSMLLKGKLHLLPEFVKDRKGIRKIFNQTLKSKKKQA